MRSDNSSVSVDFFTSTIGIDMQSHAQGSFMDRLQAGADVTGSVMEAGQDIVDALAESYAREHDFNKGDRELWEVRSSISDGRIARVLFTIQENQMILLHGFIKKTQTTPDKEKDIARKRMTKG